jgi:hypothetical protein
MNLFLKTFYCVRRHPILYCPILKNVICIQYYMPLNLKTILLCIFFQVTYPLDVLRLRLAVDPGYRTMSEVLY